MLWAYLCVGQVHVHRPLRNVSQHQHDLQHRSSQTKSRSSHGTPAATTSVLRRGSVDVSGPLACPWLNDGYEHLANWHGTHGSLVCSQSFLGCWCFTCDRYRWHDWRYRLQEALAMVSFPQGAECSTSHGMTKQRAKERTRVISLSTSSNSPRLLHE